jgi:hypothetical protein
MCFDDVLDLEPVRFSLDDVLVNITLRIDNGRFALRTDQIRSVRQASEIELFEVHSDLS